MTLIVLASAWFGLAFIMCGFMYAASARRDCAMAGMVDEVPLASGRTRRSMQARLALRP